MPLPFVIDNVHHQLVDVLNELLAQTERKPLDIATAYFSISGYRPLKDGLHKLGAFRLLLGSEPQSGPDVGLRPDPRALRLRFKGDLEAEPFNKETLALVEDLITYLQAEKVQIRLYDKGFLHAKAYLFHQDKIGPQNLADRMRPFAAIVGSSNFTGPGLATNRELNLVHRVFLPADDPRDAGAARGVSYLGYDRDRESIVDPSGVEVPDDARRFIKSEVGARAIADLMAWYEARWAESIDFKNDLIDLLDASKFGGKEYTPYEVYIKALYEYFKDEFGADAPEFGRSAVELAEFQDDSVKKARRILLRYDGVLIADSVGLGKTWIGKKLLEDFAYHRRQKALVVCSASLRPMWKKELGSATIAATILGSEELGRANFDAKLYADFDVILIDESHNFRNEKANRYLALDTIIQLNGGRGRDGDRKKVILLSATPIIKAAYPNATIKGKPVVFPDRKLHSVSYSLGSTYGGLYNEIVAAIEGLTLAPYKVESYKKKEAIKDDQDHKWEEGREIALAGIFKTRFLKRLESSIESFRLSLRRALTFEETYSAGSGTMLRPM